MANELYGDGRQSFLESKWVADNLTDAQWTASTVNVQLVSRVVSNGAGNFYGTEIVGTADAGGLIEITLASAESTWATGDRVSVLGVTGTTEANGNWFVTRISDTVFRLDGSSFTNAFIAGGSAANLTRDETLNDIPAGSRVASSVTVLNPTSVKGTADADDTTVPSVGGSFTVDSLVLYHNAGVDTSNTLIMYADTGPGFPLVPNGNNIVVAWDENGIFRL